MHALEKSIPRERRGSTEAAEQKDVEESSLGDNGVRRMRLVVRFAVLELLMSYRGNWRDNPRGTLGRCGITGPPLTKVSSFVIFAGSKNAGGGERALGSFEVDESASWLRLPVEPWFGTSFSIDHGPFVSSQCAILPGKCLTISQRSSCEEACLSCQCFRRKWRGCAEYCPSLQTNHSSHTSCSSIFTPKVPCTLEPVPW